MQEKIYKKGKYGEKIHRVEIKKEKTSRKKTY